MSEGASDETLPASPTQPAPSFAPETRVGDGRYRIVRFIASGAMGDVHEADDLVIGARIAIKVLRAGVGEQAVHRLRREIALARKVTHPHVCRVHDVGEHDGRVFLTMELLDGETLAARIRRGPVALAELERYAHQLVAGLGALHAAGIVHRDLKSSNVVITEGRAVLTDFGLARPVVLGGEAALTAEGSILGTPAYMAPEQVEGREATLATDVYSLGVVLFEMATGELPFRGDTTMAIATARLREDAPRASSKRSELPARWDAAIQRCLARDPARRFARIEDVVPVAPRRRRRGTLLAGALALVLAGAGTAIVVTRRPAATELAPNDLALAHLRRFDYAAARNLLEPRLARNPDDPWLHNLLGLAMHGLGEEEPARKHLRVAFEKRASLDEADRLRIEIAHSMLQANHVAALATIDRLLAIAPNDVEAALDRTVVLDALDRNAEALATLAGLRTGPGAGDPRVDLMEVDLTSDQRRKRELAARALAIGTEQEAIGIEAAALAILAWTDANLGELARGEQAAEEARARYAGLGDRKRGIGALNALALTHFLQGEYREANAALRTAIDLSPTETPSWALRCNLAMGLALVGEATAGEASIKDIAEARDPMWYVCRGWLAEAVDDLPRARATLDRGKALLGRPGFASVFLNWRSGITYARAGDLAAARRDLAVAIADATAMHLVTLGAQAQISLARVSLAEANPRDAETLARQALEELGRRGSTGSVGYAHAIIAEARLARGDRDGALRELAAARLVRSKLQDPAEHAALDAIEARLK